MAGDSFSTTRRWNDADQWSNISQSTIKEQRRISEMADWFMLYLGNFRISWANYFFPPGEPLDLIQYIVTERSYLQFRIWFRSGMVFHFTFEISRKFHINLMCLHWSKLTPGFQYQWSKDSIYIYSIIRNIIINYALKNEIAIWKYVSFPTTEYSSSRSH